MWRIACALWPPNRGGARSSCAIASCKLSCAPRMFGKFYAWAPAVKDVTSAAMVAKRVMVVMSAPRDDATASPRHGPEPRGRIERRCGGIEVTAWSRVAYEDARATVPGIVPA